MFKGSKIIAAIAVGAVLCTSNAWAETKYRVAHIARALGDSFAAWLANSIVKEGKKYPDMSITVFDGQSRNELMQSHIENAVTNKFDLTIIQPYDPAIQIGPVKEAMARA